MVGIRTDKAVGSYNALRGMLPTDYTGERLVQPKVASKYLDTRKLVKMKGGPLNER